MDIDRRGRAGDGISVLFRWFVVWISANFAAALVLVATGQSDSAAIPMWATSLNVVAMWIVMVTAASRLIPFETEPFTTGPRRWIGAGDVLAGVPLGLAGQLLLVNLVNWPLSRIFPDTFNFDRISERADDLGDSAPGAWKILLVLVVVVGAPLVEEFLYRGCLQTGLERTWGSGAAVLVTAAVFAAVHLSPVEFPGLFAFALLLGLVRRRTGTLGLPIITHMAFNATGLLLVVLT